jgi:capsid portal protein
LNQKEFEANLSRLNYEVLKKADTRSAYSRQREDDPYVQDYSENLAIKPPYDFSFLYGLYEESDALQANIRAMIMNVVGMGYTFEYLGDDVEERNDEAAQLELNLLTGLFQECNEEESWLEVASKGWEDYLAVGNQAVEIIRNRKNDINLFYHHPVEKLRLCPLKEDDYLEVDVPLLRNGKIDMVPVQRPFRRYIRRNKTGQLRFYKTLGDPRPLSIHGKLDATDKTAASELLWFKRPFGDNPYGLPPWIGATFEVSGRRDAQAMNWDLLRSQGIAPMAVIVEGKLTNDSWDQVWSMILAAKGVEQFNKIWVLQVVPVPSAVGKTSGANIRIEDMSRIRQSDLMFDQYLGKTKDSIRQIFRNPPGFIGETGAYSYSTLQVSKVLGEEQVYGPERILWDRRINRLLLRYGFGITLWRYKSKQAEVAGSEELRNAIATMTNAGVLTINNGIKLVNDALGRSFSPFTEKWGNAPLPILLAMINRGYTLKGIEEWADAPALPMGAGQGEGEKSALTGGNGGKQKALPPGGNPVPQLTKDDLIHDSIEALAMMKEILTLHKSDDRFESFLREELEKREQ